MPADNRKIPRKIANEVLEVFDQLTGANLGRVVNISSEGLMLISNEPIDTGSVYQLDLKLPHPIKKRGTISFGAESVWTTPTTQPGSHWTGFRIIDASDDSILVIDELIFDWNVLD